ncbi:HAD family phosphatase [bacterium]|nr:MAG: HAD family phosphatase [bacterium]
MQAFEMIPSNAFLPGETFSALLFDCDGTLVDTGPAHFDAYNEALRSWGFELELPWYHERFGLTPQAMLTELGERHGVTLELARIVPHYSEVFQANPQRLREIRAVAEIARKYHGRVPMAVASNGTRANVERTLEATGLRGLFDLVLGMEDVLNGKPAPDLYLEAARRLGVPASECIVFEDTEPGFAAARTAGMRVRDIRGFGP